MSATTPNTAAQPQPVWPHRIAILFVIMTFILITVGGAVTSYNAGMAVPDWPTSFGKWFVIPLSLWADFAVALEHNHRLIGAISGIVAIAMLVTAIRTYGWRHHITKLAAIVLGLYVIQGIMGGYRVIDINTTWAIVHGITGQLIFCLVIALAAITSRWWADPKSIRPTNAILKPFAPTTRMLCLILFAMLVVQLTLGAMVRHTHSASAIPDAPAAYGQLHPPFNAEKIAEQFYQHGGSEWFIYADEPALSMSAVDTDQTPELLEQSARIPAPIPQPWQVAIHFAHRVGAVIVTLLIIITLTHVLRRTHHMQGLRNPACLIMALLGIQLILGLSVIWSRENPKIATGHQVVGALLLGITALFVLRVYRLGIALDPHRINTAINNSNNPNQLNNTSQLATKPNQESATV